jgi:hypothetical protein
MSEAQDSVFDQSFYQPAVTQAQRYNVSTPLGLACLYDTNIQGGLFILLPRVTERVGGVIGETGPSGIINEASWIGAFLDLREERLLRLADQSEARGDQVNANALRISTFRGEEYRKLLQAGNLMLEGELTVRQRKVRGIKLSEKDESEVSMQSNARFVTDVTIPDDKHRQYNVGRRVQAQTHKWRGHDQRY